jgi:tetratricopeptide (TPR) repeat protein
MENSSQPMANLAKLQEEMEGYCGLGMYDEALHVLDSIRIKGQEEVTLSFLRTRILRAAGRYAEMRKTAEKLKDRCPNEPEAWVSLADAMRQSGSIQQGRIVLQEAEKKFPQNPHIKFQLGCYHCLLRELDKARTYVQAAIAIDRAWAEAAQSDEDLAPLRKKSS